MRAERKPSTNESATKKPGLNLADQIEIDKQQARKQAPLTSAGIWAACEAVITLRVRLVAITSLANIVGLISIIWATGTGADVTQRVAASVFGGILMVLILSLLVFPEIYSLVLQFQERYYP